MKVEDYVSNVYLTPSELSSITFEHDNKIYEDIINRSIQIVANDFISLGVTCDFVISFYIVKSKNVLLKTIDDYETFLIAVEGNLDESFYQGELSIAVPLIEDVNIPVIVGTCFDLAFSEHVSSKKSFELLKNTLYPVLKPDYTPIYFDIADIQSINRSMKAIFNVFGCEDELNVFMKKFKIPHSDALSLLFFEVNFNSEPKIHLHLSSSKFEIFVTPKSIGISEKNVNKPPLFIFTTIGANLNFETLINSTETLFLKFFNKLNHENYKNVKECILLTHMKEC
jgi:hypothetical protein